MSDKDELYDTKMVKLEKNMSSVYNNQRKQTENQLQKQKKIIENFEIDTSAKMNTVNMKLLKIDETSVIKEYFNSQIICICPQHHL